MFGHCSAGVACVATSGPAQLIDPAPPSSSSSAYTGIGVGGGGFEGRGPGGISRKFHPRGQFPPQLARFAMPPFFFFYGRRGRTRAVMASAMSAHLNPIFTVYSRGLVHRRLLYRGRHFHEASSLGILGYVWDVGFPVQGHNLWDPPILSGNPRREGSCSRSRPGRARERRLRVSSAERSPLGPNRLIGGCYRLASCQWSGRVPGGRE